MGLNQGEHHFTLCPNLLLFVMLFVTIFPFCLLRVKVQGLSLAWIRFRKKRFVFFEQS